MLHATKISGPTVRHNMMMHAGDPRQLGPLLRSPLAANAGLGESLLERLITHYRAIPEGTPAREVMCTVLVRNYRSHQRLLWLPSHLFYGDALLACADSAQTQLPQWSQLPGSDGVNSLPRCSLWSWTCKCCAAHAHTVAALKFVPVGHICWGR